MITRDRRDAHWAKTKNAQSVMDQFDPSLLGYLSPEEQVQLHDGLESLVGGERAEEFIARVWPSEPPPDHVYPIIDVIQQARVSPIRCYIDVGPGHAKTTTLLRLLIWWMERSLADQCAYITYSGTQASDKSLVAMRFADDAGLAHTDNRSHWHLLGADGRPAGGGLIAAGIQGQLTGQRVPGLILVDDPYKSSIEARSPATNKAVKERFRAIAFTRLQGGSIIVLHTRWDEDDLGGWLINALKWDNIHIPTLCDEENDILGRKLITRDEYLQLPIEIRRTYGPADDKDIEDKSAKFGQVAWPDHYPYEICTTPCGHDGHLHEIRKTIGEHLWHAIYQGRPRPLGKSVFKEPSRYRRYDLVESGRVVAPSEFSWKGKRGIIAMDTAASAKTSADWTVMLVLAMSGFGINTEMWIVDCIRVQEEVPEVVAIAIRLQKKYRLLVGVETVAANAGRVTAQMLKRTRRLIDGVEHRLRIYEIEVGGKDKYTRAIPLSAAWNDGRVHVPMDVEWADTLIEEHKKFTGVGDQVDDQVDADAHGFNALYRDKPRVTDDDYAQNSAI